MSNCIKYYKSVSCINSLLVLFLLFIATISVSSIEFKRVDVDNGLTDNFVISLFQDSRGIIWVGTMSGFYRYDGYQFISILSSKTGKPFSNRIHEIKEDSKGNLWLRAFNGSIHMYDRSKNRIVNSYPDDLGKNFTVSAAKVLYVIDKEQIMLFEYIGFLFVDTARQTTFIPINQAFRTKANDDVRTNFLFKSSDDNVWIGNSQGLFRFNRDSKSFTSIQQGNVTQIIERDKKLFFVNESTDKLNMLSLKSGTVKSFSSPKNFFLKNVRHIDMKNDGVIWMITESGLIGFTRDEQMFVVEQTKKFPYGRIAKMYVDNSNNVWFVSHHSPGIYCYNVLQKKLKLYPIDLTQSRLLNKEMILMYFFEDKRNRLWIGTLADGLVLFDPLNDKLETFRSNLNNSTSISSNAQLSIIEDRHGFLWIGTRKGGICRVNLNFNPFHILIPTSGSNDQLYNETNSIIKYNNTQIFTTYGGEIYRIDDDFKAHRLNIIQNVDPSNKNRIWIINMFVDSKNNLWLASKRNGLFRASYKGGGDKIWIESVSYASDGDEFRNLDVYSITEDSYGRIWVVTHGEGIFTLDLNSKDYLLRKYDYIAKIIKSKQFRVLRCVYRDSKNRIWIGGNDGLVRFSVSKKSDKPINFRYYKYLAGNPNSLPYHDINNIYEDKKNILWIATNGGGICRYNEHNDNFQSFSVEDGLCSGIVQGMIEDNMNNLWISTTNGLSKFNMITNRFQNYFKEDGLFTSTMSEFTPKADSSGIIYMGTTNGLLYFDPTQIADFEIRPKVLLSDFYIANKSISYYSEFNNNSNINELREIVLNHKQKDISIEFSTDYYCEPSLRRYEYMLEGYNKEWTLSNLQNRATYTNLSPGTYVFKVRVPVNSLEDPNNTRQLIIKIKRSPFLSPLAYIVYMIMLFLLGYFIYRTVIQYYTLQNNLKLERKVTDVKLRFFTNVSHELRTLLTLIQAPLDSLERDKSLSRNSDYLVSILRKNTNILLHLVGDILDFRKVQNNKMGMKVTHNEIIPFFRIITGLFEISVKAKDITYSVIYPESESLGWFDLEKMEKVLTNLLSNALKFTPKNGEITVELSLTDQTMKIRVHDTGVGFDVKDSHLFERFYQLEDMYQSQGSGIGLSLIREFVQLHKGELSYDSTIGKGSVFIVEVPIKKESYTHEQIYTDSHWAIGSCAELVVGKVELLPQVHVEQKIKNEKILVVEDNTELREFLVNSLSMYFQVESAEDGVEGYHKANTWMPDLIVTDVVMPNLGGIEMVRKIRSKYEINHTLIIMLSAKSTIEDKIDGIMSGADDYIEKPFNMNYLLLRINNLIDRRKILKRKFLSGDTISDISNGNSEHVQFLTSVENVIIKNIEDSEFGVEELSRELMLSKTGFYNKMKQLTGCSPNQFVKMIRLKQASYLMKSTSMTISEVCYAVGYNDIDHFREQFKNLFDVTPSQFKKMESLQIDAHDEEPT